jgi:acyl carrier protein
MSNVDAATIERELTEFIEREFFLQRNAPLKPDEDLIDAGFDSMALTRTLVFLEDRFSVKIPDQDVDTSSPFTVEKLARHVCDRIAQAGQ